MLDIKIDARIFKDDPNTSFGFPNTFENLSQSTEDVLALLSANNTDSSSTVAKENPMA